MLLRLDIQLVVKGSVLQNVCYTFISQSNEQDPIPCHREDPEPAIGWTRPCHPDTEGSGPCGTAQTWGVS